MLSENLFYLDIYVVCMYYYCTIIYFIVTTDWKIGIHFLILLVNGKKNKYLFSIYTKNLNFKMSQYVMSASITYIYVYGYTILVVNAFFI